MTMDYSPWSEREIWPFLKGSHISEIKEATPTIIDVHVRYINAYLHKFFELIPIDLIFLMTMDYSPWSEREIWPFLKVPISLKPERSLPPKLVYMHVTSTPTCINFLS